MAVWRYRWPKKHGIYGGGANFLGTSLLRAYQGWFRSVWWNGCLSSIPKSLLFGFPSPIILTGIPYLVHFRLDFDSKGGISPKQENKTFEYRCHWKSSYQKTKSAVTARTLTPWFLRGVQYRNVTTRHGGLARQTKRTWHQKDDREGNHRNHLPLLQPARGNRGGWLVIQRSNGYSMQWFDRTASEHNSVCNERKSRY